MSSTKFVKHRNQPYRTPWKAIERWKQEEATMLNKVKGYLETFPHAGGLAKCTLEPWEQRAAERLVILGLLEKVWAKKNTTRYYRLPKSE